MRLALAAFLLSLGATIILAACGGPQGGCEPATCLCLDDTTEPSPSPFTLCATAPAAVVAENCQLFACKGHGGVALPDAGDG